MSEDLDSFVLDTLLWNSDNEVNDQEDAFGDVSDLEDSQSHVAHSRGASSKTKSEKGDNSKKRKYNPDAEIIAEETERTLKEQGVDPQSKEGKAKRRQIRNRLSAQFHRNRKNAHMDTMQQLLNEKDLEISSLRNEVSRLVAENEHLRKLYAGGALPYIAAGVKREHGFSLSSYPDSGSSHPHTDNEEADPAMNFMNTIQGQNQYQLQQIHHQNFSCADSTCSTITATASPSDSPYRVAMESAPLPRSMPSLPPSVGFSSTMRVTPSNGNGNGNGNARVSTYGPGMIQVSGMARPLSIVTLVCMVSIMLLGSSHTPNIGASFFSSYKDQQLLHVGLKNHLSSLKAGSDMLTLVHGATGVETRYTVDTTTHHHQRHHQEDGRHGRRLSEEDSDDEESQSTHQSAKRPRADSPIEGRERSNSLFDPALMTPEEEAAATSAISALNLEHLALPIPAIVNSQDQTQPLPHTHLRHSPADHPSQPRRNVSRQVIYSSGVVNRGLVEDSVAYPDHPVRHSFGMFDHDNNETAGEAEGDEIFDTHEYNWPASQAFDYAVQSYSKVVMTDGQALLDPAMVLNKNPFQWARPMYNNKYRNNRNVEDDERAPTIVENRDDEGFVEDMDVSEDSATAAAATTTSAGVSGSRVSTQMSRPMRALPDPSALNAADLQAHATRGSIVVPQTQLQLAPVVKQEYGAEHDHNRNNLPAVIESNHHAFESMYDRATEQSVMNKILSGSNFITMKVPASSIRVGKTWSDSKSGTVESLMEVFNITSPDSGSENNSFGMPLTADASVEINCIILGAKLVVSETASPV